MTIDTFFNNDVITLSLVTNLNSSTVQEIVNWVTTADGRVRSHRRNSTLTNLFRFVETVANWLRIPYTSPTRLNSTVDSRRRRRCVLGLMSALKRSSCRAAQRSLLVNDIHVSQQDGNNHDDDDDEFDDSFISEMTESISIHWLDKT